jgi:hypothetical protein
LTPDGVQAALNAVNSINHMTIDYVNYDCNLSHHLKEHLKKFPAQPTMGKFLGSPFTAANDSYGQHMRPSAASSYHPAYPSSRGYNDPYSHPNNQQHRYQPLAASQQHYQQHHLASNNHRKVERNPAQFQSIAGLGGILVHGNSDYSHGHHQYPGHRAHHQSVPANYGATAASQGFSTFAQHPSTSFLENVDILPPLPSVTTSGSGSPTLGTLQQSSPLMESNSLFSSPHYGSGLLATNRESFSTTSSGNPSHDSLTNSNVASSLLI